MIRHIGMMQRFTLRYMNFHQGQVLKHMEKLSSGQRINRAADDAAGLAISEKMRAQIRGGQQAQRNVLDGVSLVRTAEGSLHEQHAILQRLRELSVQSANGTYSAEERNSMQREVDQLIDEMGALRERAEYNRKSLLKGGTATLQIGANRKQSLTLQLPDTHVNILGISDMNVLTPEGANTAISLLDVAIMALSRDRSRLGAYENRLAHTYRHLTNYELTMTAAESRIRDADMAKEMMGVVKHRVLNQAGMAMFLHTHQQKNLVLRLIGEK
ncbi:flagellin [Salipaludibacillus agaradhaerens]|uniref:Flagellin n=1 Tax=Salipaludibacillus agaradhaerens TaxID=76935 RepID=A0A9Q4B250_SALAG|nr:flagellin [Salipaludibacillus agaradhaerens]MCR6096929.1 flagellin [Salipaludibacillus agaradhaerens]MCR6113586.1 flagellin [Salipaludibacillus agaradhaerens]